MYECFHCGSRSVIWNSDFSFEDYGEDGEGIIHECHCTNCGALITYKIPIEYDDMLHQHRHKRWCLVLYCIVTFLLHTIQYNTEWLQHKGGTDERI